MSYNILDAVKDLVTGDLEYATKDLARERYDICNQCEAKAAGLCTVCGCVVVVKVKLKESECPMGLW
jgi:hypothetical protein